MNEQTSDFAPTRF